MPTGALGTQILRRSFRGKKTEERWEMGTNQELQKLSNELQISKIV